MALNLAPSLALVGMLGFRHGFDADHIAAVDGMTRARQLHHSYWSARRVGLQFALGHSAAILAASLLLGTPAVSAAGAIGASLTLSLRRGGLILPLIVLPLLTPAVIFGTGMVVEVQTGLATGALGFLAAFSLVTVLLSPFVAAMAVRLNLAG